MATEGASDNLSSDLLRRVILPGAVAVVYLHPYLNDFAASASRFYGVTALVVLTAEAVLFGLLVSSAKLTIFYIYEGFRLSRLTAPAKWVNTRRKDRTRKKVAALYKKYGKYEDFPESEKNRASKLYGFLSNFPVKRNLEGKATFAVENSTLLGNIIAGYESYPKTRYGIDSLFFWFHILIFAPEAARKEYEDKVAFAESLVLTSATGAIVAFCALCALFGRAVGAWTGKYLIHVRQPATTDWLGLVGGLLVCFVFYNLALPAHRRVASSFRAVTDLAMPKLLRWIKTFEAPVPPEITTKADSMVSYLKFLSSSKE
jgi:hypothetical protein